MCKAHCIAYLPLSCPLQGGNQGQELVTAPLDGTILPGITRDSILQLTRSWGEFEVSERYMSLRELEQVWSQGCVCPCMTWQPSCAEI